MVNLEPIAAAAMASGGAVGMLAAAGGTLRVALFFEGVEVSGNGYARKSTTTVGNPVNEDGDTLISFGAVTFAAVGGDIVYDQLKIFNRSGHVLYGSSTPGATQTIEPGEPHNVTTQIRFAALQDQIDAVESLANAEAYGLSTLADLQSAVTNAKTRAREIKLAQGRLDLTTTLQMVDGSGVEIRGKGPAGIVPDAQASLVKQYSLLRYTGSKAAGTPAINYEQSEGYLGHCTILGQSEADYAAIVTGTRTPVGIRYRRASGAYAGIPTGKLTLDHVIFGGFGDCLQIGENLLDANCDESHFQMVTAQRCGSFMRTKNAQGMTFFARDMTFGQLSEAAFVYESGGKLELTNVFIGNQLTLIKILSTGEFAQNNAIWHVKNVQLDAQAFNSKLLDCVQGTFPIYGDVLFDGGSFGVVEPGGLYTGPAWVLGNEVTLRITNWTNLQPNMIRWHTTTDTTRVVIDNCKAWTNVGDISDLFDTVNSSGSVVVEAQSNKQYHDWAALPDIDNIEFPGVL